MRVLDPGVGTGELLAAVARREPAADLTGWDVDSSALAAAAELVPSARLEQRSALEAEPAGADGGFDLVIANPPYFQVPVTPGLKDRFGEVISGRANVFALFFKAGLDLLQPGGTLAYIVPPSMNSGAYFEALREHIISRASIADLTVLDGSDLFEGANTAAQLLVLEQVGSGRDFVFEHDQPGAGFRRVVFSEHPERLQRRFRDRSTLWQLGYEAVTGTVVWNQRRADLRESAGPGTVPLIWSRDLRGGSFNPCGGLKIAAGAEGDGKHGHIVSDRRLCGPALLVNRVIGAVGRGDLRTALVPDGAEFLAENHVNVIRRRSATATDPEPPEPAIDWSSLQQALETSGTVSPGPPADRQYAAVRHRADPPRTGLTGQSATDQRPKLRAAW